MDHPVLSDKSQYPTDEIIFGHLGKKKDLWVLFFDTIRTIHPTLAAEWRYYNDGKSWLMKVTEKKKTVFWLSLCDGSFRITFYFTDKAARAIAGSKISDALKEQFAAGKRYNKIRGLTIFFKFKKDIEAAKILIPIKLSMK